MSQRLTLIVTELGPGGAETQVFRIAGELHHRGHEVRVVSLKPPVGYVRELEEQGITVQSLDLKRSDASFRTLLALVEVLERYPTDALFCFLFHANVLGSVAGRLVGVPRVVTSIRGLETGGRLRDILERTVLEIGLSDRLVTNSYVLEKSFLERGIARRADLEVIPNGIDLERFSFPRRSREETRESLDVDPRSFLWICVANVLPIKDLFTLLRGFQTVAQSSQLLIVGAIWDMDLKDRLDSEAQRLGIESRVRFLGSRKDVPELLNASDGFVMSSVSEGTPNAIIEAMASGICVVSTAAGGVVDLVQHGSTGLLVPVGDSKALGQQMVELMKMAAGKRATIASRAREFVRETHNLSSVVDRWESLI